MTFKHIDHGLILPKITRKTTENGRKYFTPEGNTYPSITTVLSILSKKSINEWRDRVGHDVASQITTQAGTRGAAVHQLAEDYINNDPNWAKGVMPSNLATFMRLKDYLDKYLNDIWFQEQFLYSDKLKCAGQVDLIGDYRNKLSIVDFKTSLKPKKIEWVISYFIQTSFYACAFYEHTNIPIKQGVILVAVDNGETQEFIINTHDYIKHYKAVRNKFESVKGY